MSVSFNDDKLQKTNGQMSKRSQWMNTFLTLQSETHIVMANAIGAANLVCFHVLRKHGVKGSTDPHFLVGFKKCYVIPLSACTKLMEFYCSAC